jgi:hypothetical protein
MTCLRTVKVKTFILDDKPFNFAPSIARPLAMALAVELKTEAAQFLNGILDPVYRNVDCGYQLFWDIRRYKYTGNHWSISTVMAFIVYSRLWLETPRPVLSGRPGLPWQRCHGAWQRCAYFAVHLALGVGGDGAAAVGASAARWATGAGGFAEVGWGWAGWG